MDELRAEWAANHQGQIHALAQGMIYDGMGESGNWDKLQKQIGTKGAPFDNARPWTIFTKNRVTTRVHKNGKVELHINSASPEAADAVGQVLEEQLGAEWLTKITFLEWLKKEGVDAIRYGVPSPTAMQFQSGAGGQAVQL